MEVVVKITNAMCPEISDWYLDSPTVGKSKIESKSILFQGWVLGSSDCDITPMVQIDTEFYAFPREVNRPDVVQSVYNEEPTNHSQLKCGFHFRVPVSTSPVFLGFQVNGEFVKAAEVFITKVPPPLLLPAENVVSNSEKILFVHLPKTAGTSFRMAAEEYFGKRNTLFDYGLQSPQTSGVIKKLIYQEDDRYQFAKYVDERAELFLSGHFPAGKYSALFQALNLVTFVREPVQQVVSHFEHFKNVYNYNEPIEVFVKEGRFKNSQSRMLHGRPLEALGFVGLTEEYSLSLSHINRLYGTNINEMQINLNAKKTEEKYTPEDEVLELIKACNEGDIEMYQIVSGLLQIRTDLVNSGLPFTHGKIQDVNRESILGWAYFELSDAPVGIDIYRNGNLVGQEKSIELRPGLKHWCVPRNAYIGFRHVFDSPLVDGDEVSCKVACSGQKLTGPSALV